MTAHVALDGFIELASALPMPTVADQIVIWRSSVLHDLATMRSQLERAMHEAGADVIGRVVLEQIPLLRGTLAEAVAQIRAHRDIDEDTLSSINAAVRDIDNRLYALELDFDPEANVVGAPSFDNADDLIRALHED